MELLKTRQVRLRGDEVSFSGGEFDRGIFAGFGNGFRAAERFQVCDCRVELLGGDGESRGKSAAGPGAGLRAQVLKIALMDGNDLLKLLGRTIERLRAGAQVSGASDGELPGKCDTRGVDG